MRERGLLAAWVAAVLAILVAWTALRTLDARSAFATSDFLAFYCAGQVADDGLDPYRADPLLACELVTQDELGVPRAQELTSIDPAPLPPTVLLAFRPLSRLGYADAARIYVAVVLALTILTIVALTRATRLPWWAVAPPVALGGFEANAIFGQLPPIGLAGIALAGWAAIDGRPRLAALATGLALVQPNVGLPVAAALFLWVPRTRGVLAIVAIAYLAIGSLLGPQLFAEYVHGVVPAQALAEAGSENQRSATWLAWLLGAPDSAAVAIGGVVSLAIVATAIALAKRVAVAVGSSAAIVFLPAAASVTFAEYVHADQFVYAAPFALLLASATDRRVRALAWTALTLVIVRPYVDARPVMLTEAALVVAAVVLATDALPPRRRLAIGVAAIAFAGALVLGIGHLPTRPLRPPSALAPYRATGVDLSLASGRLGEDERRMGDFSSAGLRDLGERLPAWLGLTLLMALAVRSAAPATQGNQIRAERG